MFKIAWTALEPSAMQSFRKLRKSSEKQSMKRSHQAMFEQAFDRHFRDYTAAGVPPHIAEELAADKAWQDYERYCDDKLHEQQEEGNASNRI